MKDSHIFIDTNILVYAFDRSAGQRHERCKALVKQAWERPYPPAISVQVLQELYVNLVKKKVPIETAQEAIENFLAWEVVENNTKLISDAFSVQNRWNLSFWDASIIAAAMSARARIVWTEDLTHGQKFDSLEVVNPFCI